MVEHFDRKSSIDRNALKKELMGSEAGIQDRALEIPEPFGQLILRVCRFECLRHSGDDLCLCQVVQKETAFVLRGNPQRGPLAALHCPSGYETHQSRDRADTPCRIEIVVVLHNSSPKGFLQFRRNFTWLHIQSSGAQSAPRNPWFRCWRSRLFEA